MKQTRCPVWQFLLLFLAALILFRDQAGMAVKNSIDLCLTCVIPSLFPFFILSNLLMHSDFPVILARRCAPLMHKWFHLPAIGTAAVILGLLGGYPIGAKTAAQLCSDGHLTKEEAGRLLAICNNTGPAIFFGLAGTMLFEGFYAPLCLYLIHMLSVLLTGRLLRPSQSPAPRASHEPVRFAKASVTDAIWQGALSCGKISAFVIAFGVVIKLLLHILPPLPPIPAALITGLLDLPNGLAALQGMHAEALRFIFAAMIINWGGLCVHMQTKAVVEHAGICLRYHLQGKLMMTLLSGLLSCAVVCIKWGHAVSAVLLLTAIIILFFIKSRVEIIGKYRYNSFKAG